MKSTIERHPAYMLATSFAEQFKPKDGVTYRWVYDYALGVLGEARQAVINIETKAHKILDLMAPLAGIAISLLAAYVAKQHGLEGWARIYLIASFSTLTAAIVCALIAVKPRKDWTFGPPIANSLAMAEHYQQSEQMALGRQTTALMVSVRWMCILMERKAFFLTLSYSFLFASLLFAALLSTVLLSSL